MITTRRAGFTLVEMLVVAVLAAVVVGAVYQTLIVQEQTSRASSHTIRDQDALRTSLGILEAELREVATTGSSIGGVDIAVASSDSVVFRAQRKLALICTIHQNERRFEASMLSDNLAAADSILIFVENSPSSWQDDAWRAAYISSTQTTSTTTCVSGTTIRRVNLPDGANLVGVTTGAPIRSFEWVTYGLYDFGHLGWGLGRRIGEGAPVYLVNGFAPRGEGLVFTYYDASGNETTTPSQIARIRIAVRMTQAPHRSEPAQMTSNLYLRNN